ncbi:MAG: LacI family DNA-binding transcriptional regulator [Pseudomonadota bacterium]
MVRKRSIGKSTSVDVAREAGVSQSAVSRTFTPGASVAKATRERVMEAAKRLGYRPNAIARSLITRRSQIIAMAVSYFDNHFYPELVQGLSDAAQSRGYHILLFTVGEGEAADQELLRALDYQIDGLVLASVSLSSEIAERCHQTGIPVVMVNRVSSSASVSKVTGSNWAGGRTIAQFLVAGGHKRIAYLAGIEETSTNRDREAGFRAGLKEAGKTLHARACGNYDAQEAAAAARMLMTAGSPPDAIFCANDHMAIAAMDALRFELGLDVPKDVSIVGFDNVGPVQWPAYDITSFSQPVDAMIEATSRTLFAAIDAAIAGEPVVPKSVEIPGRLIARGSTRPARGVDADGVWRPEDALAPVD